MAEQRLLWLAFLDIECAYINMDRALLWKILEEVDVNEACIELLRETYQDNQVRITWEGITSRQPIVVQIGLEQGCSLSPLVFTLYAAGIERRLEGSKLGFDLCHRNGVRIVEQRIPGLIYAADIVLLAGNVIDLQRLADICGKEATSLGLKFSTAMSGIMLLNSEENRASKIIEQEVIPVVQNYKYLEVNLSDREVLLDDHKEHLRLKSRRNAALLKHRSLRGFNTYEAVRAIWKGVMVPAPTFSNAV